MMKKRKKKFIIAAILSIFPMLLVGSYMLNPQPVHAMMVDFSSMEERVEHVYVEPDIPVNMEDMILNDLTQSKERISEVFDGLQANPTILFVQSSKALEKYAQNNRTAQTYYTYWGHYIVVGPDGFNEDVIAHELLHSELRTRLMNKDKVPVWFDEGLATVVDHRYIRDESLNLDHINDLSSRDAFYEPSQVKANYEIAHSEVVRWFGIVGKSGLMELIEGLNQGGTFNELYKAIESRR
ncbi:hypothetical protein NST74_13620 [Paenibacillus sp. FSL F4-0125]|uniref:hypothetical protein n=1 Tax=Paenibacillus sp. FSL F4-0125 TaxID=2954730 RepID=UPI0030F82B22